MKNSSRFIFLILVVLITPIIIADDNRLLLSGPYLGQSPPGLTPELFADGIINGELHGCPVFTLDGMEAYWSLMDGFQMQYSTVVDGEWSDAEYFESTTEFDWSDSPILAPDGNRLFFQSYEPTGVGGRKENIWFMDRDGNGWTSPQPLSEIVNIFEMHWQVSVADNCNLYFSSFATGDGDIYLSRFVDGAYTEPEVLGPSINGELYDFEPFIAP
ncbi:MAG: hypothetical protein GY855_15920, partial [candidate division Zixibacteria bacterium]|nr:hypothetical protein [candidate division Zixibacteria bacterium]